ncbi:MAG: membrane protein insertion efficiency factor YidD [Pseudomonadota bacterium]
MLSKMALAAIWGYQQYISPHKGFRCAYSVQHGGTGCSGYAKFAIREHGIWRALPIIRQRLRDCKEAYQTLRANCTCRSEQDADDRLLNRKERAELERRRKKDNRCCTKSDFCFACGDCGSCGGGTARVAGPGSSKFCDVNPCDGDIGIGGCDCASCDCGGCSCGG